MIHDSLREMKMKDAKPGIESDSNTIYADSLNPLENADICETFVMERSEMICSAAIPP